MASRLIATALNVGCIFTLAASNTVFGHPDPPTNPPVMTNADIPQIFVGGGDFDDGFNGESEFVFVYDIDWGGTHGTSTYMVSRNVRMGQVYSINNNPLSLLPQRISSFASHTECTPASPPTYTIRGWETDKDLDPFSKFLLAVGSGLTTAAIGGPLAGLLVGPTTTLITSFFSGDDVLTRGLEFGGVVEFSSFNLPNQPVCGSSGTGTFSDTTGQLYQSAAANSADPALAALYTTAAQVGIDEEHPFSRNASYATGLFSLLLGSLEDAAVLGLEPGGIGDIGTARQAIFNAVVDVGAIVARQTRDEAIAMSLSAEYINSANAFINGAQAAANSGDYRAATIGYENATVLLLPVLHPAFVPEPDSLVLFGVGFIVLAFVRQRRRTN